MLASACFSLLAENCQTIFWQALAAYRLCTCTLNVLCRRRGYETSCSTSWSTSESYERMPIFIVRNRSAAESRMSLRTLKTGEEGFLRIHNSFVNMSLLLPSANKVVCYVDYRQVLPSACIKWV